MDTVTATLVGEGGIAHRPDPRRSTARDSAPGNHSSGWLPGVPGFVSDTWVFFALPSPAGTGDDGWGLRFGPDSGGRPRWSLVHCADGEHIDTATACPHAHPSDGQLLRWSTSVVGSATAGLLLEAVGYSNDRYRQYFDERPDLRDRWVR